MNFRAKEFTEISEKIFYPIYPVIAEDVVTRWGKRKGLCLDIGGGNGLLAIAIAEITDMNVCIYDICGEILEIARESILARELENRISTRQGSVENMTLAENSADLAVSRGSIHLWEDKVSAIREIYRVLKPGGFAYIGGGFGNKALEESIDKKMTDMDSLWLEKKRKRFQGRETFEAIMKESGIENYRIISPGSGLWITFSK